MYPKQTILITGNLQTLFRLWLCSSCKFSVCS